MSQEFNSPYSVGNVGGSGLLLETLKSSFLFNFRTGNVMIDTFITALVIFLSTYVMGLLGCLQYINWKEKIKYLLGMKDEKRRKIVISSNSSKNVNGAGSRSPVFSAILHRIKQIDCDESGIIEMSEIPLQNSSISPIDQQNFYGDLVRAQFGGASQAIDDLETESKNRTNLIVNQSKYFKLAEKVHGTVKVTEHVKNNPNMNQEHNQANMPQTEKEFEISIESSDLSMNELRSVVQTWVKEYLKYMEPDKDLHYFQYQSKSNGMHYESYDYVPEKKFSEFRFESSKRFENLFFPEKEELIQQLDHFMNNESWYKEVGLPHTLGLLFHGEPGCGKTSTIKAIANYTHRHIVSISLSKIKTQMELFNVFYNDYINDRRIPIQKRLYVLEDIDCSDLEDIVGDRSKKDREGSEEKQRVVTENKSIPGLNINLGLPPSTNQPGIVSFQNDKSQLTLADILEALDGVMEMDGRMLIITTNYPEKLDAALVRPGRIDVQLKFGKCTMDSLVEICDHFYRSLKTNTTTDVNINEFWPESFDKTSLPENKWTPAEVTQILVKNIRAPGKGLQVLQL